MYKVGDEIFIKGIITKVNGKVPIVRINGECQFVNSIAIIPSPINKIQADHDRLMKYQERIGSGCVEFGGIWKEIHALRRVLKWMGVGE